MTGLGCGQENQRTFQRGMGTSNEEAIIFQTEGKREDSGEARPEAQAPPNHCPSGMKPFLLTNITTRVQKFDRSHPGRTDGSFDANRNQTDPEKPFCSPRRQQQRLLSTEADAKIPDYFTKRLFILHFATSKPINKNVCMYIYIYLCAGLLT